jgi:hypothetical protein
MDKNFPLARNSLKGLSSENQEGSKVVSIERSCFKHVVMGIYFNFFFSLHPLISIKQLSILLLKE